MSDAKEIWKQRLARKVPNDRHKYECVCDQCVPPTDDELKTFNSSNLYDVQAGMRSEIERLSTRNAELAAECERLKAENAVDGPVYNAGRQEGQADIAVRLRKIVDPSDVNHWNVDACLAEVERLRTQLAAAQKTIERLDNWKLFLKLAKDHYWDSLESDKEIILLHLTYLAKLAKENPA